jgi:hypothetical protein
MNGDRKYNAVHMAAIFDGIIRDGVLMSEGGQLMVTAGGGMEVRVASGRAWFDHTWTYNNSVTELACRFAESILNRIDALVLEVDRREESRMNSIKFVYGEPASVPVRPALIKQDYIRQYPLAYIYVANGVSEIRQADITNMVGSAETPFVTAPLEKLDAGALLTQWEDEGLRWQELWRAQTDEQMEKFREFYEDTKLMFEAIESGTFTLINHNFDDWCARRGCDKQTVFAADGNSIRETIVVVDLGFLLAERITAFLADGRITETVIFHKFEIVTDETNGGGGFSAMSLGAGGGITPNALVGNTCSECGRTLTKPEQSLGFCPGCGAPLGGGFGGEYQHICERCGSVFYNNIQNMLPPILCPDCAGGEGEEFACEICGETITDTPADARLRYVYCGECGYRYAPCGQDPFIFIQQFRLRGLPDPVCGAHPESAWTLCAKCGERIYLPAGIEDAGGVELRCHTCFATHTCERCGMEFTIEDNAVFRDGEPEICDACLGVTAGFTCDICGETINKPRREDGAVPCFCDECGYFTDPCSAAHGTQSTDGAGSGGADEAGTAVMIDTFHANVPGYIQDEWFCYQHGGHPVSCSADGCPGSITFPDYHPEQTGGTFGAAPFWHITKCKQHFYTYTCEQCGEEFTIEDGYKFPEGSSVVCPECREGVTEPPEPVTNCVCESCGKKFWQLPKPVPELCADCRPEVTIMQSVVKTMDITYVKRTTFNEHGTITETYR